MLPIVLPQKILHKTQVNATCDSSGPTHSSHLHFLQDRDTVSNVL